MQAGARLATDAIADEHPIAAINNYQIVIPPPLSSSSAP